MTDLVTCTLITNATIVVVALIQNRNHKVHEAVSEQGRDVGVANGTKLDAIIANGNGKA